LVFAHKALGHRVYGIALSTRLTVVTMDIENMC